MRKQVLLTLGVITSALLIASAAQALTIDFVTVGNPGNTADGTGFGSVATTYRISETEVTNVQYAEFLNAVDPDGTNPNGIYNTSMGTHTFGGINFTAGNDAGTKYEVKAGRGAMPVDFVSFWDSLRFVNWLHNGQGSGDTETGAYTITAGGISANSITRNTATARFFLPSEDEWYKAAFFNGTSYFDFPAGTDMQIVCAAPGATANTANCDRAVNDLTIVGSYTGSPSPYGTFDQGGNVWEWTETIVGGSHRVSRGASFPNDPSDLSASVRSTSDPDGEVGVQGFRVATIPEPTTALLLGFGLAGLAAAGRRRSLH